MVQSLRKIPLKILFFAFAVVMLTVSILQLPTVGADEDTTANADYEGLVQKYDNDHSSLAGAILSYHKNINEIFDEHIEKLLSGEVDGDNKPKYSTSGPPLDDSGTVVDGEQFCKSETTNVSTYCLGFEVLDEYTAFMVGIETHRSQYQDKIDDEHSDIIKEENQASEYNFWRKNFWFDGLKVVSSEKAINHLSERVALIDEQTALAKDVMVAALDTYDELQIYYALHLQYYGLIEDLEGYRDALSKVRAQVEKYPGKFHDMTTTDCT